VGGFISAGMVVFKSSAVVVPRLRQFAVPNPSRSFRLDRNDRPGRACPPIWAAC